MKKYLVEFIWTLFFVLTITLAVNNAWNFAPLAIGSALMVMIYAWGHVSGWHFNPAVSVAVWLRWKSTFQETIKYRIAQIIGACLGAIIGMFFVNWSLSPAAIDATTAQIIVAEIIATFALAWVVLHVATDDDTQWNSFYGLAIWFTVMVCAFAFGSISWWAFNPAVSIGQAITWLFSWNMVWIHLVGQFVWAILAAYAYKAVQ